MTPVSDSRFNGLETTILEMELTSNMSSWSSLTRLLLKTLVFIDRFKFFDPMFLMVFEISLDISLASWSHQLVSDPAIATRYQTLSSCALFIAPVLSIFIFIVVTSSTFHVFVG